MVLFDSGGSMSPYHQLTGRLFSAVSKSNHFKDLQFYYFHNCVYEKLYTTPYIRRGDWVDTDFVLSGIDASHKLIFVGDAAMAPPELERTGGNSYWGMWNEEPGIEWLKKIKKRAEKSIWLNPLCEVEWQQAYGRYTINKIADIFPMFEMTLDGLERGIRRLLVSR
jgi:uncharacterized protein with von Willebrand factor type A (vWA) domain